MSDTSDSIHPKSRKARWIAGGFLGAFAASVLTVIYTGLNVEGSRAEFDVGFRPVTMTVGEVRTVEFVFDAEVERSDAVLDLTLPDVVRIRGSRDAATSGIAVATIVGVNTFPVEVEAVAPGSGYLVARVSARDEPIGIYRLFVTVTAD